MPSLRLRRFFYYLYLLLFLITAPTVVLYTAGYRFDFRTQSLVKTGALSVTSVPRGARVFLDEDEKLTKTPALLKNVIPGTYDLSLTKEGYHAWMRQVSIESRQTTLAEEIVLFLDTNPVSEFIEGGALAATASGNEDRYAYVRAGASWFETWETDPSSRTQTLLDRTVTTVGLTPVHALRLSVHPALPDFLFSEQENGTLMQKQESPQPRSVALLPNGTYRAIATLNNGVLVMEENGTRLLFVDTQTKEAPILLNVQTNFFEWNDGILVYGDAFEVHRFDARTNMDRLVTRSGEPILDAHALNDHTYLFVFDDRIAAYDVSDAAHPVTTILFDAMAIGQSLQNTWLSQDEKTAYIAATDTGEQLTIFALPLQE